ncbi:MAG: hypothetical protein ACM3U2_15000 [Deltaproteobacteria bacterium]
MLPFRTYDIPGALAAGFLVLAACEAGYDGSWLIDQDWNPERITVYGSIALCIGLVVALASRYLIEHKFVLGWLKAPEENLLGGAAFGPRDWRRRLFPAHYAPLEEGTRGRILSAAGGEGPDGPTTPRVRRACAAVQRVRITSNAFSLSLHLYTTYRTLCLGLLLVSAILASGIVWHSAVSVWGQAEWRKLGYCLLSLFEAVGMLYRYLRFYRRHAVETLLGCAGVSLDEAPFPNTA